MVTSIMKMLSNDTEFTDLEKRAHLDLAKRARGGTVIYLMVWLISATWAGMAQTSPLFLLVNTLFFLVGSFMRVVHYRHLTMYPESNTKNMYHWLVGILLFSGLHWGALSAWIIFCGSYPELYYPYMVILVAFGVGGTSALSISRAVSLLYPLFVFMPTLVLLVLAEGEEDMMMVMCATFALIYVLGASRLSRDDYWSAIASQKVAEDQARVMEKLSITDQLTRLNNRMYFENRFIEEWDRCGRMNVPMAIFMIDLDHFKMINDTYGHAAGDECLVKVAAALKHAMKRTIDTVVRYGGEEFIVMIAVTDVNALPAMAQRLVDAVAAVNMCRGNQQISVSCSVGLASVVPSRGGDKDRLLRAADKALYQAKDSGRNRYCIYNESPAEPAPKGVKSRKTKDGRVTLPDTEMTFA